VTHTRFKLIYDLYLRVHLALFSSSTFAVSRSWIEAESRRTGAAEASWGVSASHVVEMSWARVAELTLVHVCAQRLRHL